MSNGRFVMTAKSRFWPYAYRDAPRVGHFLGGVSPRQSALA